MKRCPLTYALLDDPRVSYSLIGLHRLSPRLHHLKPFPYTAAELHHKPIRAQLNIRQETFELAEKGAFILKPASNLERDLPANEDLTMRLAHAVGIDVPLHGLIYNFARELIYFVKQPQDLETFTPSNIEEQIKILDQNATFPTIERGKLWERMLFCLLTGIEPSPISLSHTQGKVQLTPVYGLVNTAILHAEKQHNLTADMINEHFDISPKMIDKTISKFASVLPLWQQLIEASCLSSNAQRQYANLVYERARWLMLK